jgi:hypothetical protein
MAYSDRQISENTENLALAAAHYTLSTQNNLSCHRQKMHVNSAITLLKKIKTQKRGNQWGSQMARAYFKRAELLAATESFVLATNDYQEAITVLEQFEDAKILDNQERLLIAQSAISIADLLVNEEIDDKALNLNNPLFYINKALEYLAELSETDDVLYAYAYAHQIAGVILSVCHLEESKEAFQVALRMAFKTKTIEISPLLADIYTCLGLLYEQQYEACAIKKDSEQLLDYAMIYFGIALLFSPTETDNDDAEILELDSLFELIHRVLDPYVFSFSYPITCDFIDALVYAYGCMINKMLPNKSLEKELDTHDAQNNYVQHLYWLAFEAHCKKNPRIGSAFLDVFSRQSEYRLYADDILSIIQQKYLNNVYYLPDRTRKAALEKSKEANKC